MYKPFLLEIIDLEPPFFVNSVFRADFGHKSRSPDPKYDADWYKTIVGWSGYTGNTFLIDLIDYFRK